MLQEAKQQIELLKEEVDKLCAPPNTYGILVLGHTDDERVVTLSEPLRSEKIRVGDHIMVDPRTQYALEKMPKSSVEEVMLEEIPDVSYDDIGGLGDQIEILRDSVE
ncbi:MAG: proteasome ATPase, partial [Deltaproteobacteria bacterium]|nr:proteasome ATPase [Deltaproteobacteria bacterium]